MLVFLYYKYPIGRYGDVMDINVYADMLFLLNFIMHLLIIRWSGKLCGKKAKMWRNITGAAFASVIYVIFYIYGSNVIGLLMGLIGLIGGLAITYAPLRAKALRRLIISSLLLTITLGGGCLSAYYILISVGIAGSFPLWLLAAGAAAAYIAVKYTVKRIRQGAVHMANVDVRISVSGKFASFTALVDTGHNLREPISGKPVIVAEFTAIMNLLPDEIKCLFNEKAEDNLTNCADVFSIAGFANRLRLLPYCSIGERNGMLIGFRPDMAFVGEVSKDVIVAVYNDVLSSDRDYAALISAELMEDK